MHEQVHFQALGAGTIVRRSQLPSKHHIDLPDVGHAHDRIQLARLHDRLRLLQRFPASRFLRPLAKFHEAGRKGPESHPRIDRSSTQQDAVLPLHDAARDDFGIFVQDRLAQIAHQSLQVIAGRDFPAEGRRALGAKLHGCR